MSHSSPVCAGEVVAMASDDTTVKLMNIITGQVGHLHKGNLLLVAK